MSDSTSIAETSVMFLVPLSSHEITEKETHSTGRNERVQRRENKKNLLYPDASIAKFVKVLDMDDGISVISG